jgi:hypothetical protein
VGAAGGSDAGKEIVFDMWIDASDKDNPVPLSSIRSEFVPD